MSLPSSPKKTKDPKASADFGFFSSMLKAREPFVYVRFSDGEIDIMRNRYLELQRRYVRSDYGLGRARFRAYDTKLFDPQKNQDLREALIESATFRAPHYWKGVPAEHNNMKQDQLWLRELNGDSEQNLTFADLFLNEMYRRYLDEIVPLLLERQEVIVFGNHRMKATNLSRHWDLFPVPDNAFGSFADLIGRFKDKLESLPSQATVLLSASSVSNIAGLAVAQLRPDVTAIDIGTTLHPFTGLGYPRGYHMETVPWFSRFMLRKMRHNRRKGPHLTW